ncbi:MAG: Replicative DNA helicase [Candidatus Dichloromethanomonas elyunquensis]|nr:MAG: Replicative DNA helicase [Candidatus Dichloromethanomonas elyunquensis]
MYQDLESERCLISSMLEGEDSLIEGCAALEPEDFTEKKHIIIFDILTKLYQRAVKPTFLEIVKEGKLSKEDRYYLQQISGYHVSSVNLPYWLENVKDKSNRRKLRISLMKMAEDLKNPDIKTEDLISEAQKNIIEITTKSVEKVDTGKELADLARTVIKDKMEHKGELEGIPTGIKALDRLTAGFKPGELILLTAESGHGKTAFAQNFILKGCFMREVPTLYINSEMSKKQIALRYSSMLSEVNADRIKYGEIEPQEYKRVDSGLNIMGYAPFYHFLSPDLSLNKVVRVIRKYFVQKEIKYVVLDYVGRMDKLDKDIKEWQVLENIVKTLKTLGQELQIAIVVLAQLNEDQKLQAAKRMRNEADIMLKIFPMSKDDLEKEKGNYWLFLDKNRDGQSEIMIPVLFKKEILQVVDVT